MAVRRCTRTGARHELGHLRAADALEATDTLPAIGAKTARVLGGGRSCVAAMPAGAWPLHGDANIGHDGALNRVCGAVGEGRVTDERHD